MILDFFFQHGPWLALASLAVDLFFRGALALRIIMRRRAVGVTFAWLTIVLSLPYLGALLYLLLGELRLGNRRAEWARRIHAPYQQWIDSLAGRHVVDWEPLDPDCRPLSRLAEGVFGSPALPGNRFELLADWRQVFQRLIADIDSARSTCHLEFYIWAAGGMADEVAAAVIRAAERGVTCRVLLDDVGSRPFLRGPLARRLRAAGVKVQAALPAGLLRMLFYRVDLRFHRKIVVIDGEIGYTGSLNLVDPRYFKRDAGVGQWVDAMVRIEGPVVESLALTFLEDWELEAEEGVEQLRLTGDVRLLESVGEAVAQAIPSGPVFETRAVQDVLLMAIYSSRRELILTSPYFVPDEVLVTALTSAARRGVEVTLIIPAKVDSFLVRWASRAYQGELMRAGVRIARFDGGLLHTKSVTVDGRRSLFGSLNLDSRSLHLNFEITLAIYNEQFTSELRDLQLAYLRRSQYTEIAAWQARGWPIRLLENSLRLLSPLL